MTEPGDNDREEARRRARERLAARQEREAAESGHRRPHNQSSKHVTRSGRRDQGEATHQSFPERVLSAVQAMGSAVWNASTALGPKAIALALGAIILLILLIFGISSCVSSCSSNQADQAPTTQDEANQPAEPIVVNVPESINADLATALEAAAVNNADIAWIANHAEDYAMDGEAVQTKLLELAVNEPEAVSFVRDFIDRYPAATAEPFTDSVTQGTVPRTYQWDQRWGYTVYSSTTFSLTGCCPTALSMVYSGLTGKADISPFDMGVRAQNGGYMTEFDGTDASFLIDEAPSLGLSCSAIGIDGDSLRAALNAKQPVICNVGPGDFTSSGHYFVITGLNEDGTVTINDPYSAVRSQKTWDIDLILGQTIALYAYGLA
ncbi:MAG: C39 family peptidase [Raoultibacter sp.]